MVRALFADNLEGKIGSVVLDPYGRKVGVLVGFSADFDSHVEKVSILTFGDGKIHDFKPEAIDLRNGIIILKPEWKVSAERVATQYAKAVKKLEAVKEMKRKGEITAEIYNQFAKKLEASIKRLRDEMARVKEMMKKRKSALEAELDSIKVSRVNLRMALYAGELSRDDYNRAWDKLNEHEEKVKNEIRDLEAMLKRLEELEIRAVEAISEEEKHKEHEKTAEDKTANIMGAQEPIPVKIIG